MSDTQLELTPWFSHPQQPVRTGVYQVQGVAQGQTWWCWWDAEAQQWGLISGTTEGAVGWRGTRSDKQARTWRGVLRHA